MSPQSHRFGAYRLLPQARELWRGDERIALPPRALDCLVYLIEHRDRAVGRDELIAAVWGRTEVSDAMVAQTVLRIRRALGDSAESQDWVRTVPRFGYRWIAPIDTADDANTDGAPDRPAAMNRRSIGGRLPVISLLVLLAIAALAFRWAANGSGEISAETVAAAKPVTVLVLPFSGAGDAETGSWMRLGLMDLLAERLRRGGLPVLPSEVVVTLAAEYAVAGQPPDLGALFAASEADLLVAGQVARHDGRWRASLAVHAPTQAPKVLQAEGDEAITATQAAAAILLHALGRDMPSGGIGPAEHEKAELLARAEAAMLTGHLGDAASVLEKAPATLADDADILLRRARIAYRLGRGDEAVAMAEVVLAGPAAGDPHVRGRALNVLGNARLRGGDFPAAAQAYERAIATLPESARDDAGDGWNGLGVAQSLMGKLDQARRSYARARALLSGGGNPLALARTINNQGLLAMTLGHPHEALVHFDEAARELEQLGARDELLNLHLSRIWARLHLRQLHQAAADMREAAALAESNESLVSQFHTRALAARVAIDTGALADAERWIARAETLPEPYDRDVAVAKALLAAARRQWASALEFAEAALRYPGQAVETRGAAASVALDAALALGDDAAIERSLDTLRKLGGEDQSGRWKRALRLADIRTHMRTGKPEDVVPELSALFADCEQRGTPSEQVEVGVVYANTLLGLGRREDARSVAELLAPWLGEDYRVALLNATLLAIDGEAERAQAALAHARQLAAERPIDWPAADTGVARR